MLSKLSVESTKCNYHAEHLAPAAAAEEYVGGFHEVWRRLQLLSARLFSQTVFGSVLSSFWGESERVNGDADLFLDGFWVWAQVLSYSV